MRGFLLGAWLLAVLSAPALAGTHKVPDDDPIATINIPEKWKPHDRGDGLEAIAPDGGVSLLVVPVERKKIAEAMGEAMRYLRNTGGITVQSESAKNERGKLNGIETKTVIWQGKDNKGDIQIRFTVFLMAENKPLLVAYWGSPDAEKKHQAELNKMLQSIKKAQI